ncbi:Thermolysin metallopeptidase, catalytic domain [Geosmithia morbida]|uniref:Thermolysin metallopeptidase, catalytic domain n=1 Tax=Geosmithia morbida TaxID=1094350 RepID=A0A9P4YUY3_9HYPO|nr:Thermolysin metallopeptidase, catalytic domain [Geosmithia morbida]KAF4122171.1 Thermolysin metallopeptidase, catalytic domain [Geosmithia morbida]
MEPPSTSADTLTLHEIQLRHKLSPATIRTLSSIPSKPDRRTVLETACHATETRSFSIKQVERAFFRHINENTQIPYLVRREAVTQPWHKVFLLVQVDLLGSTGWPNRLTASARKELLQERGRIYAVVDRVLRCIVDILGQRLDGRGVGVALDVLRSVRAGVWDGRGMELVQVDGIGRVKMERLVAAGVRTVRQLSNLEFYHIERLLTRNPPFGQTVLRQLAGFPLLRLKVDVVRMLGAAADDQTEGSPLWIARIVIGYENEDPPQWRKRYPWTTLVVEGQDGRLVWFWRGSVRRLEGGKEMVVRWAGRRGEKLNATFACEELVGTSVSQEVLL